MWIALREEPLSPESPHFDLAMGFETSERIDLRELATGRLVTIAIEPRWKDYDAVPASSMAQTLREFDTTHWGLVAAFDGLTRVGGAIIAFDTPGFDLLEGRRDITTLLDIRVAPATRGMGVGRQLFRAVEHWSRNRGARFLTIETQDINVGACRFYHAMGCTVRSTNPTAYPGLDEAQIIWQREL